MIVFNFRGALIEFFVEDSDPYESIIFSCNGYKDGFIVCSFERFLKIANKNYMLAPLLEAIISKDAKNIERIRKKINSFLDISAAEKCETLRYKITKIKARLILGWQIFFGHK